MLLRVVGLLACSTQMVHVERTSSDVEVISSSALDVRPFNSLIDDAARNGAGWTRSPLLVCLHCLDAELGARKVTISEVANRTEQRDTVSIELLRNSLADDSVRGEWYQAILYRQDDGTWRFVSLRRAIRCWRRRGDSYSRDLCP